MDNKHIKEKKIDLDRLLESIINQNKNLESENIKLEEYICKMSAHKKIFENALKEKLKMDEKPDWLKFMLKK